MAQLLSGLGSMTWGSLGSLAQFCTRKLWKLGAVQWMMNSSTSVTESLTGSSTCSAPTSAVISQPGINASADPWTSTTAGSGPLLCRTLVQTTRAFSLTSIRGGTTHSTPKTFTSALAQTLTGSSADLVSLSGLVSVMPSVVMTTLSTKVKTCLEG